MEMDLFFVREKVLTKKLNVVHVPAIDQLADILTKALSPALFLLFRSKLRVVERLSSKPLELSREHKSTHYSMCIFLFGCYSNFSS